MLLATCLCQPLWATNPYKCCFNTSIYDEDVPPALSLSEKRARLISKKEQAIKMRLLDPLDHEIERLNNKMNSFMEYIPGGLAAWAGIIFCPPSLLVTLPLNAFCAFRKVYADEEFWDQTRVLKDAKFQLKCGLSSGSIWELEQKYIIAKPQITKTIRHRIENLLIDIYNTDDDHEKLINDLLAFPSRIKCLSVDGSEDKFVDCLERKKRDFYGLNEYRFASIDAMMNLAEASFNALTKKKPSRSAVYFESSLPDLTSIYLERIATRLGRRYFIVEASKDNFSLDFLYGSMTNRGILLEAFLANKHEPCLNPILIIIGIDNWITEKNLYILNNMLDPDAHDKTFKSNYFGLDIDWSALSVLSCGKTSYQEFPKALKSRLKHYKIIH